MKPRFLFLLLLILPLSGFGKPKPDNDKDKALKVLEDSLRKMGPSVFTGKDEQKFSANKRFSALLLKTLNMPGAFDFPFDSLKFIANLIAPDKSFRIFNWDIPKDDGTYMYYGFVFVDDSKVKSGKNGAKNKYTIYELEDKSNEIKNPELSVLSPEKWFGALYYQIILKEDKDKKYYTLLGWDGNNSLTWKKIIDAITFGKDGKPIFGEKNIFQKGKRSSKRVIFEFRGELTMTLHWDDHANMIVYDHLAPEVTGAEGMYQFYSSDGSYDGYVWKKGMWKLIEDTNAHNPKDVKDSQYNPPTGDQTPSGNNNGSAGDVTDHKKHFLRNLFKKRSAQPH